MDVRTTRRVRIIAGAIVVGALSMLFAVAPRADAAPQCTTRVDVQGAWLPGTSGGSIGCYLGRGNAGTGVWTLQVTLNNCYGAGLVADGIFGPKTEYALKVAQQLERVRVDGVYGQETIRHLRFLSSRPHVIHCFRPWG